MPLSPPSEWQRFYLPALATLFAGATYGLTVGRPIVQSNTWHFVYAEALQFPYPVASTQLQLIFIYVLLLIIKPYTHLTSKSVATSSFSENVPLTSDTDELPWPSPANQMRFGLRLRPDRWTFMNTIILSIAIAADVTLRAFSIYFAPLEIFLLSRALVLPTSMLFMRLTSSKYPLNRGLFSQGVILSLGVLFAAYRQDLPRMWHVEIIAVSSAVVAATWPFQFEYAIKLLITPSPRDRPLLEQLGGHDFWRLLRSISKFSAIVLLPVLLLSGELGQIHRNCYFLQVPNFWIDLFAGAAFQSIRFISSLLFIKETSAFKFAILAVLVNISQVVFLTYSELLSSQWFGLFVCVLMATCFCCSSSIVPASLFDRIDNIPRLFRKDKNKSRRRTLFKIHMTAGLVVVYLMATMTFIRMSYHIFYPIQTLQDLSPLSPTSDGSMAILHGNDSYLGHRPDVHAVADLDLLVDECRGTYKDMEHMRDVQHCLDFLATKQDLYLSVPDPAATNGNEEACNGPIVLYHLWWTGLPSWRTELCIKSYFHTQNLPCSRLWIWINVDQDPKGVFKWMDHDRFQHFIPLVETGAIVIKEWRLPARVPLPKNRDPLDRARYYTHAKVPNADGKSLVADAVIRDASGQEYLQLYDPIAGVQLPYFTVAVSDAARLIILHLHGGIYMDMDIILLRDMRPLVLPGHGFAERWGSYAESGMYNNALLSLPVNSTLSSYLLHGGTRMGLMFHFQALGRMLRLEERDDVFVGSGARRPWKAQSRGMGLVKLETAFFDPMWAENDGLRVGKCTVPCIPAFEMVFQAASIPREWEVFKGVHLLGSGSGSMGGVSNRTMENFYRGAWAYHIHNQWHLQFEQGSWIDIITRAHDGFFNRERVNPYGETWEGPVLDRYV